MGTGKRERQCEYEGQSQESGHHTWGPTWDGTGPSELGPLQQEVVSGRAGNSIKAELVRADRPVGRQNGGQA